MGSGMPLAKSETPWLTWLVLGIVGLAGVIVLFCFDPALSGFYPVCLFHRITGLQCPGCGGLRALHQLLHGHVAAAFHFNPLVVLALPFAGAIVLRQVLRYWRHEPFKFEVRLAWLWVCLGLLLAFGIGRNLV